MTVTLDTETRQIVRSYHDAWVSGNVDAAGKFLADEVINPAPFNNHATSPFSRADYVEGLRRFRQTLTGLDMISELYGGTPSPPTGAVGQTRPPVPISLRARRGVVCGAERRHPPGGG